MHFLRIRQAWKDVCVEQYNYKMYVRLTNTYNFIKHILLESKTIPV